MKPMTFKRAAEAVGSVCELEGTFDRVSSDTRKIIPGSLFAALKGENFDGNDFAAAAIEKGASAVVCEKDLGLGKRQIVVKDSRAALLALAGAYRSEFEIPFIGVTGSAGKTTAKEMICEAMSVKYKTHKTQGNLNNEIGVSLTLLGLESYHEAAVVEMGTSGFGEISRLTRAVKPDAAVITNIGAAHLEKLGSLRGVLKAKLEILEGMEDDAPLILNGDDETLAPVRFGERRVVYYGIKNKNAEFRASDIVPKSGETEFALTFPGGRVKTRAPFAGRYNVYNALAAAAAASVFGIEPPDALESLKKYVPVGARQKIVKKYGIVFIEDCYNSNPDSLAAALDALEEIEAERRIAVLGDMLELGEISARAHCEAGVKAARNGIDAIFTYGERALEIARGAVEAGAVQTRSFDDKKELSESLASFLRPGDAVLFKASRAMKLEDAISIVYSLLDKSN